MEGCETCAPEGLFLGRLHIPVLFVLISSKQDIFRVIFYIEQLIPSK